ncbi:respiratory nitrate reductase subunit gamma [Pinisolibacter aquiterrae]|uniref:respiratory nitrate reductase subunit gamma n=1 Tax=Pinisolibacter aquiterrae TaxID=2815579 RepID=UPI001C3C6E29|nr:respiratory nitrate reductase subunit gamma [Pinisolibacter aquiterrae]MCC8234453.1 respiratory nitrate reductase subunit gamma [Pinisolibacter aquiterrae]
MLTTIYACLFYGATAIFLAGMVLRITRFARTPAPLKIPTMPAPTTKSGVAYRLLREVTVFESLFRANKWIWAFGWIFHVALAVVLIRHLRYFVQPVPSLLALMQPLGVLAGFAMVAGLAGLWGRRLIVPRIRYITGPSDHLMLALLVAIGCSGLLMKFVAHTDIVAVKTFFLGLMRFDIQPLPSDPILLVHLGLVATLMIVFPFSKLVHAAGVFFSPSRNQVDDSRERRHLAPWAAKLEADRAR